MKIFIGQFPFYNKLGIFLGNVIILVNYKSLTYIFLLVYCSWNYSNIYPRKWIIWVDHRRGCIIFDEKKKELKIWSFFVVAIIGIYFFQYKNGQNSNLSESLRHPDMLIRCLLTFGEASLGKLPIAMSFQIF
jgi:hypothetical protein